MMVSTKEAKSYGGLKMESIEDNSQSNTSTLRKGDENHHETKSRSITID
jgi:hypothetical protein